MGNGRTNTVRARDFQAGFNCAGRRAASSWCVCTNAVILCIDFVPASGGLGGARRQLAQLPQRFVGHVDARGARSAFPLAAPRAG